VLAAMRLGGPDIFQKANSGSIKFTDDVFIKAGQMVQDMVNKGWFPAGANGLDWDTGQSRMLMYQEQCAMIVQTSGLLAAIRSENPDFYSKKLGVSLYPAIEGGKGKATDILGGSNMFSVSANSKNKEMAKKLAMFLATDNQMQQEFLDAGTVAAKPGLKGNDPLVNGILSQLANATFFQNYIDQTLSPELAEVHKDTCQALIGKTMTPAQVAETMQKAFDNAK
jgi:raffinose/stachyose/melibiose transport system substrate-binding protein